MDGSVYNLNVPLDVGPKMYFSLYRFITGCFFFLNDSLSGKKYFCFLFAWNGVDGAGTACLIFA